MLHSLFITIYVTYQRYLIWIHKLFVTTPRAQRAHKLEIRHMFTEGRPLGDGNISKSMVGLIFST